MCGCNYLRLCPYHEAERKLGLDSSGTRSALKRIIANYDDDRFDRMLEMHRNGES